MITEQSLNCLEQYLHSSAPILYLALDEHGSVTQMNRFASKTMGNPPAGTLFSDLLYDQQHLFNLEKAAEEAGFPRMLNVNTGNGTSQTYFFHIYPFPGGFLVLGHMDVAEIELLSHELIAANQELNNLTRQLNKKNKELARANEKILELTRIDPLTELWNRRYFNERSEQMEAYARRRSDPLSMIMTDIDKFKYVNDTFGHDAGDKVLKAYADLMKSHARQEDMVVRFGGEEFIILLPSTGVAGAYKVAERIRADLSGTDILENGHFITASFGVSRLRRSEHLEVFIKRADTALYEAKKTGRNRVVCADQD